jgi:hypothetical protein
MRVIISGRRLTGFNIFKEECETKGLQLEVIDIIQKWRNMSTKEKNIYKGKAYEINKMFSVQDLGPDRSIKANFD